MPFLIVNIIYQLILSSYKRGFSVSILVKNKDAVVITVARSQQLFCWVADYSKMDVMNHQ